MNSNSFAQCQLVIFDCDGVLVDSELITNRVYAAMLNELGLSVTLDDMLEKFVGRSMDYCWTLVTEMLGRPLPENLVEEYRVRTTAALHDELRPVRGIEGTLATLESKKIPYCVASSGTHAKMRTTLGITGLLPRSRENSSVSLRSRTANHHPMCTCWLPVKTTPRPRIAASSKTVPPG